ncbi:DUF188 domain-containing protein [Evansella clarkii]|uniref:DUF188 domain-containing protein n=1 Tax=Evansella clarkii TaxID=79879 RepID=UPI001115BD15|nr:DUF188 domain-containing protein [Evansella clarkii]
MQKNKPKIFVDGDSCPVVPEVLKAAENYRAAVVFVSSYAHIRKGEFPDFVVQLTVDQDKEAADLKIANEINKDEIAVTDDLGLSSLLLGKGVTVLNSRGRQVTNQQIDYLLDSRYQSAKLRRAGKKTKGPKKLTSEDRETFIKELEKVLSNWQEF